MKPMFWVWMFWFVMWAVAAVVNIVAYRKRRMLLADRSLDAMWGFLGCMVMSAIGLMVAP
jgi:hypothetical protein